MLWQHDNKTILWPVGGQVRRVDERSLTPLRWVDAAFNMSTIQWLPIVAARYLAQQLPLIQTSRPIPPVGATLAAFSLHVSAVVAIMMLLVATAKHLSAPGPVDAKVPAYPDGSSLQQVRYYVGVLFVGLLLDTGSVILAGWATGLPFI